MKKTIWAALVVVLLIGMVTTVTTNQQWHNVYEYGAYLSNLFTVPVGTVISMGTPPGSHGGLGRFMVDGDLQICSYEGHLDQSVQGGDTSGRVALERPSVRLFAVLRANKRRRAAPRLYFFALSLISGVMVHR